MHGGQPMNKQIEEMAGLMTEGARPAMEDAERLYEAGYRKQSEGEWVKDEKSKFKHRYHCTACDFYLIGAPTKHCPNCGARMKGDEGK